MSEETAAGYMEAAGSLAKATAEDLRRGRLWPGELGDRLVTIRQMLDSAAAEGAVR